MPATLVALVVLLAFASLTTAMPTRVGEVVNVHTSAGPGPPCVKTYTQAQHARFARAVYSRSEVRRAAQRRIGHLRRCQQGGFTARKNARAFTRKMRGRYKARKRQASTASTGWAIPAAIVMCESKGDYQAQNPSGAYGAYQLMPTWWAHLGRKPTPREQDQIAAKLWDGGRGAGNWVCKA